MSRPFLLKCNSKALLLFTFNSSSKKMRIICQAPQHFVLQLFNGTTVGNLCYQNSPSAGSIETESIFSVEQVGVGSWHSYTFGTKRRKIIAEIKVRPGGLIVLNYTLTKKKYKLRNAGIFKNRFILCNSKHDEMLSLLPVINWDRKGHDYSVQINEEYHEECSPSLILHAAHCTNSYLGMLNGTVPALISI